MPVSNKHMDKRANPEQAEIRQASAPSLDSKDRRPVTKADLEDIFSRLASTPPESATKS